jgi:hypothetical protein
VRVSRRWVMAGFRLVGLLAALRPGTTAADLTAAAALFDPLSAPLALGSPWQPDSHLASIVVNDILGITVPGPPTRADAIRVPAVARSRGVVCTTIARIDLAGYRGDTRLEGSAEPSWLHATDGPMSPFQRLLWSFDDLFFYGWSAWAITARETVNGVPDAGFPTRMQRLAPLSEWRFEPDTGRVLRPTGDGRWRPAGPREVVLIPGPHGGLLNEGAPAVAHARDLQRTAHNAARFPSAYLGLKQTSGTPLRRRSDDPDEVTVETVLRDWRNARLNPDGGGVAWLGGVEAQELGTFAEHLVTAGRNAADVDIARHAYIPADLIDASVPESSLHYSTSRDNDRRAVDYGLGAYMSAFSGRMSQDDVVPRGQRVAFDLERWLGGSLPQPGQVIPGQPAPTQAPGLSPAPTPAPPSPAVNPYEETPA